MKTWLKRLIIFILLAAAIYWAGKGIFIYKVFSTHDGLHHIARSFDAVAAIKEGHFPLRWAGSLNYWCGVPIFDLFYPLIYYIVVAINVFTQDVFKALNLVYFGSLALGTISFYLWIKEETGKDLAALGGALVYLYAPYRFSLIFVRGSPEFLAYAILPIVLWLFAMLFNSSGKKFVVNSFLAALAGGLLAISHNFTVMFVMPIILLYLLGKILTIKPGLNKILLIAFAYISAFGLGSFFIGPALLEKHYTRIGENSFFWVEHFPTLGQLIKSPWGYFYSSFGTHNDGMSFMLGYAQWLILAMGVLVVFYELIKHRLKLTSFVKDNGWILFFLIGSLAAIYLILPWSIPVWEKIKLLQEIQFSWRLLGIAIFTLAALFAFILAKIKVKFVYVGLFVAVVVLAFIGNRNHLLPQPVSSEDIYRFDDFERLHPHRYSTTTFGDDVIAKTAPSACWFITDFVTTQDNKKIPQEVVEKGNTYGTVKFKADPKTLKDEKVILALGYFPGIYQFYVNGLLHDNYSDCQGLVCLDKSNLRDSENIISWKIVQSPIQQLFNYLTLAFFGVWILILLITFIGLNKLKKNPVIPLLVFTALALFMFFRFYDIPQRIGFGWDQERDAWAVKSILAGDLTLIGPRIFGPAGFFLPPYFFYLLVPFYAIAGLHPVGTLYFLLFYNLIFFATWFLVVRKIFNSTVASLSLLLWAVHPMTILSDSIPWNPVVLPLIFALFLYSIFKYAQTIKRTWLFLSALLFSLGMSFHFQFLLFFPIFWPVVKIIFTQKPKVLFPLLGLTVIGLSLPFTPLVLFDLKNNFLNFNQALAFLSESGSGPNFLFLPVWDRVGIIISGLAQGENSGILFHFLIAAVFLRARGLMKTKNLRDLWWGLTLVWIVSPLLFLFFGSRPSEYYFNFLLPPFVLLFGVVASYFLTNKSVIVKAATGILVVVLIALFSRESKGVMHRDAFGLREKDRLVSFMKSVNNTSRPSYIAFNVPYNEDAGFRYLISYHTIAYPGDPKSPMVEVLIPPHLRVLHFKVGNIGITWSQDWLDRYWLNTK